MSANKDVWDKVQAAAALIASVMIPLAALVVGNFVTSRHKEAENRIRYLELAVSVLRTQPTAGTTALREWAVDILASQSPSPLSEKVREELRKQQVDLNVGYGTSYGYGGYTVYDYNYGGRVQNPRQAASATQ